MSKSLSMASYELGSISIPGRALCPLRINFGAGSVAMLLPRRQVLGLCFALGGKCWRKGACSIRYKVSHPGEGYRRVGCGNAARLQSSP